MKDLTAVTSYDYIILCFIFQSQSKKAVVVTARVHPGETNGSWMMKGLLDYLLSDAPDAKVSLINNPDNKEYLSFDELLKYF